MSQIQSHCFVKCFEFGLLKWKECFVFWGFWSEVQCAMGFIYVKVVVLLGLVRGDETYLSQVEEKPKKQRLLEVVGNTITLQVKRWYAVHVSTCFLCFVLAKIIISGQLSQFFLSQEIEFDSTRFTILIHTHFKVFQLIARWNTGTILCSIFGRNMLFGFYIFIKSCF